MSVGAPGSGTELIADRVLAAAGLDPRRDITRYSLSVSESAGALKDGKLDAIFWSGGVPTPAIQDLAATPGLSIVAAAVRRRVAAAAAGLRRSNSTAWPSIPGGTYRGLAEDLGTVGVKNLLVASSQLDADLVAEILRVIFENKDALVAAHPEARHLERPVVVRRLAGAVPSRGASLLPGRWDDSRSGRVRSVWGQQKRYRQSPPKRP